MRRYLATLHKRSDRHKQNFALLVSGGVTLLLFSGWYFFSYNDAPVVAEQGPVRELAATNEVSPLESLTASVGEAWHQVNEGFGDLFNSYGR